MSHAGRVTPVELLQKPVVRPPAARPTPETPEWTAGLATDPDVCLFVVAEAQTDSRKPRKRGQASVASSAERLVQP